MNGLNNNDGAIKNAAQEMSNNAKKKSLKREEKTLVSNILTEKRDWKEFPREYPKKNELVVIRFTNPQYIYAETDTEVYYAEDIKVAKFVKDYNYPDDIIQGTWVIEPPYTKYDYSPMSNKDKLLEGAFVTHWASITDKEIDSWHARFSMYYNYNYLRLETDEEIEEDVYRSLMWGASFIARNNPEAFKPNVKDPELAGIRKLYNILCDLQYLIDKGIYVLEGDEKPVKPFAEFINAPEESSGEIDESDEESAKDLIWENLNILKSDIDLIKSMDELKKDKMLLTGIIDSIKGFSDDLMKILDEIKDEIKEEGE